MKFFLNDNIRSHSRMRGVTRCFWHIADGLINHFQNNAIIFSPACRNYGMARHIHSIKTDFKGSYRLGLYRLMDKWAEWASNRARANLFFSPYYGKAHPKATQIFMVHDMIHALPQYRIDEHPLKIRFRSEVKQCLE